MKRIVSRLLLPAADALVAYAGLFFLAQYWNHTVLSGRESAFPNHYFYAVLPLYILVWLLSVWICKGYKRPLGAARASQGIALGTVVILLVYALLPESLRFSRAVILLGTMWTLIAVNLLRSIAKLLPHGMSGLKPAGLRRVAVVGGTDEAERVLNIVRMMDDKCSFCGIITTDTETKTTTPPAIGNIAQISDLLTLYRINEVIFCSKNLSSEQIIDLMCQLPASQMEFKIAPEGSMAVIGSSSIFSPEAAFTIDLHSITQPANRRKKRAFDVVTAIILLLFIVIDIWLVKHKGGFIRNIFSVLACRKSWVGLSKVYAEGPLAQLKPGVLRPTDAFPSCQFTDEMLTKSDQLYARDYTAKNDLVTMIRGFRKLGGNL